MLGGRAPAVVGSDTTAKDPTDVPKAIETVKAVTAGSAMPYRARLGRSHRPRLPWLPRLIPIANILLIFTVFAIFDNIGLRECFADHSPEIAREALPSDQPSIH
jgi:hypothetical protein